MANDYPGTPLKRGSRGDAVKSVQDALSVRADGFFGANTESAVCAFQRAMGLVIDGIVGQRTWAKLFKPVSAQAEIGLNALNIAHLELGVVESPVGSNSGEKVNQYLSVVGLNPGNPWCMAFVYWCVYRAANQLQKPNHLMATGSCSAQYRWARKNGLLVPSPQKGDIFLCIGGETGHYHTGFVASTPQNGRFATIEGNSNSDGGANGTAVVYRPRGRRVESCHYIQL